MDKYEYKVRSEEISKLIDEEKYTEAVNIADTIDWRRVKSATMLLKIAALYRVNRRNEDSREILMLAYDRYPTNRSVVYSLCELSIELDDVVAAIEYYKQFVKLAPKDNGVYTLRYRILEAQEASLEERIEILEELKKRDYQEEWAYELAYLYHRVGLATKCVEECDDIILWFGDGPYVMKAMELKALHVPLTEVQQAKYDAMLNHADQNYSEETYISEENGEYAQEEYAEQGYENGEYTQEEYAEQGYENGEYAQENYAEQGYENGEYAQEEYAEQGYENGEYTQEEYAEQGYVDDGYGNLSYVGDSYPDNGYTGEFYVEQTLDENGNVIEPETYSDPDSGYGQETPAATSNAVDMSQYNTINLQKVVAESMRELFPDDDVFAEDREKYNSEEIGDITGNTHIYPNVVDQNTVQDKSDHLMETADEIYDMDGADSKGKAETAQEPEITEEAEEAQEPEITEETETAQEPEITEEAETAQEPEITEEAETAHELQRQTDKIAQMVTGVSEAAPEPHTGAIKKVIIPGEDARFIKADSDMDELRDTTEKTVNEEHNRMEYNDENVYRDQNLMEAETETVQSQTTGSMNLDDVLEEWERIKLDNAKKHQEKIKQHVLTQTGKILANFDHSIKSGILGELEREEAKDGFLEADITGDIPQQSLKQTSDNDFDVEYVADTATDSEGDAEDSGQEYFSDLERVVAQELGGLTQDIPQIQNAQYDETPYTESYEQSQYDQNEYAEEFYEQEDNEQDDATEYSRKELDPEEEESIAEMAKEDALKTQEIKMNTADLSSLSEKIVATTKKEASGAKREEIRDFTPEEQALFENFAVTKKIKKQIVYALDNMTLAAYTGNILITGDAGLDTIRMAKNLIKEYHAADSNFSGKVAKITGEKINKRNIKDIFEKLDNGGIIIEKANGMSAEKLYEMASLLNQETFGIIVIMEDTKKEITKLLEKQAMIADYFNIRIDLMEMDNNALVAYAKNYALALEYSIDELGTLALYTRIANMQSGNHVVTKDEVRDIIDEAIWKSKKSKIKNFVDVLFARRYDSEDMIVLKERDFI